MAGRIEIDDVAPVVSGGRFPAKAVVGEVVAVRATVWREGHDAVSATLVVRYHGTGYPRLAGAPASRWGWSLPTGFGCAMRSPERNTNGDKQITSASIPRRRSRMC